MIRITLYKNCRLTNEYKVVFSPGTNNTTHVNPLDGYLNGHLNKKTFTCDTVYQENQGTLIFDIDIDNTNKESIYNYNYMKVETLDENSNVLYTRYCFIDKIALKNEYCYVDYSEDIWHSYSYYIENSYPCAITRNLHIQHEIYNNLYKPSIPYASNDSPEIVNIANVFGQNNKYNLMIEIQYYRTDTQGEITERKCDLFSINNYASGDTYDTDLDLDDVLATLNAFIDYASDGLKFFYRYLDSPDHYTEEIYRFQLGKIYVFPAELSIPRNLEDTNPNEKYYINITRIYRCEEYITDSPIFTYNIANNFKNISVGTLSHQIKMTNNGTTSTLELYLYKMNTSINLMLLAQNELVDITSDFEIEFPVKPVASEELSLLKLSKQQASLSSIGNLIELGTNIIGGYYGTGGSALSSAGPYDLINIGRMLGSVINAGGNLVSLAGSSFSKGVNALQSHIKANKELFTSNEGKIILNEKFINCAYGLCILRQISENDSIVNYSIWNFGYDVFQPIQDIEQCSIFDTDGHISQNEDYDIYKFDDIRVTGTFPQEISEKLSEILNNGIKIFYLDFIY